MPAPSTEEVRLPSGISLRPMATADLPEVLSLQELSFANPWNEDMLQKELTHEWSTVLLAEGPDDAGAVRIQGILIFWIVHDEIHVLNVATAPHARLKGIARGLLETSFARGKQKGCVLATLEVRRSNTPAIQLYQRLGFRTVGVRTNYYVEEHEDALVMVLDL